MKYRAYWSGRPAVYRLRDASGRLIYIGSTPDLPRRIQEHRSQAWWAPLITKIEVRLFPDLEAARSSEAVAIQEEQPTFNQLGTGRPEHGKSQAHWTGADRAMAEAHANAWMTEVAA